LALGLKTPLPITRGWLSRDPTEAIRGRGGSEVAQFGLALSEQVALAEEHLVVPPAQRLADGAVAPPDKGAPRTTGADRQLLNGHHLNDHSRQHSLIVGEDQA
jgi:hypothetical protein